MGYIFLRRFFRGKSKRYLTLRAVPRGRGRQTAPAEQFPAASVKFYQEVPNMRVKITLACTECKQRNYNTKKNKKNDPDRLEMNKYCKFCKKHTVHKETK